MGESYCYLKKSKRDAEKPKAQTLIVFTVQLSTAQCCEPAKKVIILEINSGNVLRAIVVKNTFCAGHTTLRHHLGNTLKG